MAAPQRHEPSPLCGSLDRFPLADVLGLLALTGTTGALEVTGDRTEARLFVDAGSVVAAAAGTIDTPVEVVTELLRLGDVGDFAFAPDEVADHPGPPLAVPALLTEARARLDEWYEIEAVLPSVDHVVVLASMPPGEEVVVSAKEWRALAAIGGGGPIGLLLERLADDELDALRMLRVLVEAGLLEVVDPQPEPAGARPGGGADDRDRFGPRAGAPAAPAPVLVVRASVPPPDPEHQDRLDALGEQLDLLYELAQVATAEAEAVGAGGGIFHKLRHRDH